MLAVGSGLSGNGRAHSNRTHRPGTTLGRGTWIRVLLLAMAMAWVGSVEATESGGSVRFGIRSVQHVSYAAPDLGSNAAPETAQRDALVFEVAPSLGSEGALVITPTFDSSITGDPNAAAIEAMITNAINVFESQFSDPITVAILFRYATTGPDGRSPSFPWLGQSDKGVYIVPWNEYISALVADATTTNDVTANASLPGSALDTNVDPSPAGGRAVGLPTPPATFADGSVGNGAPYDGIVTLNSSYPFAFARPPISGEYDAQRVIEHEIDEVLGFGSYLNLVPGRSDLRPQDLFSWSAPGVRNLLLTGTRYFSIDGGTTNLVRFNQDPNGDFGDWMGETSCPYATPLVQAPACQDQVADVTGTSPEGINLDVIGYDLISARTTMTTTTTTSTTTTSTTTTTSSTTTTLPCTTARCTLDVAVMSPVCSAGPLPMSVTRPLTHGVNLADQAATSSGKRARKLRGRATKVLKRAETAVTRAARGKKPKIAAECAAVLNAAAVQVVDSLGE